MKSATKTRLDRYGKPIHLRPWIVWVEEYPHLNHLILLVIKPKHNRFLKWGNRWRKTLTAHWDGPILYSSPQERMERIEEMLDAGKTHTPDNVRHRTALSIEDVKEIVDTTWRP